MAEQPLEELEGAYALAIEANKTLAEAKQAVARVRVLARAKERPLVARARALRHLPPALCQVRRDHPSAVERDLGVPRARERKERRAARSTRWTSAMAWTTSLTRP